MTNDTDDEADSLSANGVEEETDGQVAIAHPFDPALIDVDLRPLTLDLVMKRMRHDEIDLRPAFQRNEVWSPRARSRLIESILVRIPLPAFYIDGTNDAKWVVVDGLQRLSAIKQFAVDETMKLKGLEFLTQFEGFMFKQLPRDLQRRMEETQITVYIIRPGTPENVKFNIFDRINTGAMPLSLQEIRQALNQGPATLMLERLARSDAFQQATAYSIRDQRMTDREFVLRFIAFFLEPSPPEVTAKFDFFLHEAMKKLNTATEVERQRLETAFARAMDIALQVFGDYAFRKRATVQDRRNRVNKALFESWSVAFARLSLDQVSRLIARKEQVVARSIALMQDTEFNEAISQSTGDPKKIRLRFERVQAVVDGVLAL